MTVDGRLFHAVEAETGNARSPSVDLRGTGTTRGDDVLDGNTWGNGVFLRGQPRPILRGQNPSVPPPKKKKILGPYMHTQNMRKVSKFCMVIKLDE